ncbi:MAG: hypothetical protein HY510_06890, partial [Acidobacteria bacterium]|nr:hypothetical protein [Acidobacteriota bacterium]
MRRAASPAAEACLATRRGLRPKVGMSQAAVALTIALFVVPGGVWARPDEAPAGTPASGGVALAGEGRPALVRLEVEVDRKAITVGDPIVLTIRLTYPRDMRITSFSPESALDPVVLLGLLSEPPKTLEDGSVVETRTLRVTAYEPGSREIPALVASYVDASGKAGEASCAAIPFEVASVLGTGDTRPADIKPPARMPERRMWPWVLAALGLLGAGAWLWWRRRRRCPAGALEAPAAPPLPPHETAYAELERLLASGLLERGSVKEFYIELAEILRRYLEGRYGIDTFERTT